MVELFRVLDAAGDLGDGGCAQCAGHVSLVDLLFVGVLTELSGQVLVHRTEVRLGGLEHVL